MPKKLLPKLNPSARSRFPSTIESDSLELRTRSSITFPPSSSSTSSVQKMKLEYYTDLVKSLFPGQKTVMMSPMDFYSSITPDCSIHPGAGSGIYEEITEERLIKTRLDKSPAKNSVLNVIGENGLITYNDYCFLLALLSTPVKFIDTAFNVFDVTGDGKIEAKVREEYN